MLGANHGNPISCSPSLFQGWEWSCDPMLASEAQGKDWRGDRVWGIFCFVDKKRKTVFFSPVDEILGVLTL